MCVRSGLLFAQHDGEEKGQKTEDAEGPHPRNMAGGVFRARLIMVVQEPDDQRHRHDADLLDQGHDSIGRSESLLVNDVGNRGPHHRGNQ